MRGCWCTPKCGDGTADLMGWQGRREGGVEGGMEALSRGCVGARTGAAQWALRGSTAATYMIVVKHALLTPVIQPYQWVTAPIGTEPVRRSTGSDRRQPRHERRHPVPSRHRRQDRCARIAGKNCHSAPPTPPIGPQSSGSARRWPSFEGELHVERFRATLNGLGGLHMGNPG